MASVRADLLGPLLEELRARYAELDAAARVLASPNEEDTHDVKCAFAAFSLYTAGENWQRGHFEFLGARLDEAPELYSAQVLLLGAMCWGAMCGMAYERQITEREFRLMDLQLPGYLLSLGGEL